MLNCPEVKTIELPATYYKELRQDQIRYNALVRHVADSDPGFDVNDLLSPEDWKQLEVLEII